MFDSVLSAGVLGKALENGLIEVKVHDLRDFTSDKQRQVDDRPFGGKPGMVLKPEPIFSAVETVRTNPDAAVVLLSPQGKKFDTHVAEELAGKRQVILICGRYEGVDERVNEHLATHEISIGDYVLTGGELPAMVVIDVVTRLLPGVLGDAGATANDSHARGLLEGPHYTRPAVFRGWEVPDILCSGDHAAVARWRHEQSLRRTFERRPELLERIDLTSQDRAFLTRLAENGLSGKGSET